MGAGVGIGGRGTTAEHGWIIPEGVCPAHARTLITGGNTRVSAAVGGCGRVHTLLLGMRQNAGIIGNRKVPPKGVYIIFNPTETKLRVSYTKKMLHEVVYSAEHTYE